MSEIKVACFDVDGHLIDSVPALVENHRKLYKSLFNGVSPTPAFMHTVGQLVGRSAEDVFRILYPGMLMNLGFGAQKDKLASLMDAFGELALNDPKPARPIPGVARELERLHDGLDAMYLVTNRRSSTLPRALASAGIDPGFFDEEHTYAAERVRAMGGKAGPLREIKQRHGLTSGQMSMSGDDIKDVQAGLSADVQTFFVPRPDLSSGERRLQTRQVEHNHQNEVRVFQTFRELGRTALLPVA